MTIRIFTATVAAFIFIFVFGWAFHGILLKDIYAGLPAGLYRPEAGMQDFILWLLGGQFVVAIALTLLISRAANNQGLKTGAYYGFMIGLLSAGSQMATYALMPIPLELLAWWVAGSLVEMTLIGMLIADLVKQE